MESHVLLLRNDSNGTNSVVAEIIIHKALENILKYGRLTGIFDLGTTEIHWKDPEFIEEELKDVLFDHEGMPKVSVGEPEFWELLKDPSGVITDYLIEICESLEGLVADNRDALNDVMENYIVEDVEVSVKIPTHIALTITGAQVNAEVRTSKSHQDKIGYFAPAANRVAE